MKICIVHTIERLEKGYQLMLGSALIDSLIVF